MSTSRSRIRSINPKDPNALALIIEAIEVSEGVRGKEEDRKPTLAEVRRMLAGEHSPNPLKRPNKSNPASFIQPPSGLRLTSAEFSKSSSGSLEWLKTSDNSITGYTIEVYPNEETTPVFSTSVGVVNSFTLPYFEPGHYDVRMRAIALGGRSEITQLDVAHEVPLTTEITGLQLVGGFADASALFTWQPAADEATMDYLIQIYTVGGNTPIYTERVTAPYFEFSYAKNLESGLRREFTIQVVGLNLEGATGASASITVKNPEPVTPVFSQVARTNSIQLSWSPNTATDYVGTKILWRKVGQGFTEIVVPASDGYFELPDLDSSSDYEIKMAGVDVFGEGVYSALSGISTLAPVNPGAFVINEGVNQASTVITPVDGYVGVKLWLGSASAPTGNPIYAGGDLSIIIPKLASGAQYHIWYRALDLKGATGALVGPVTFSTVLLGTPDIDGLSSWATKLDKADAAWIDGVLQDDAIKSTKIKNLTAAKLTAGFVAASIGITSGGSIESSNVGYKTGIGVYDDNGTIYTLMTANDAGDIKAGITADGVFKGKGVELEGQMIITGGSGYANLDDKPTSLSGINSGEGAKLGGIATGADKTKTVIDGGLITTGSVRLSGSSGAIWAGKSEITSTAKGFWAGMVAGIPSLSIGSANSGFLYDGANDKTTIKAEVEFIAGSSGYDNLDDKPSSLSGINSSEGTKLGGIASGADKTKTIIDGGLITTGSITLDGTTGSIQAGKTGFSTAGNGFWLGQSGAHDGAFVLGNPNENLYFRADTGLRLNTPDLTIGAGGSAAFSGLLSCAGGYVKAGAGTYTDVGLPWGIEDFRNSYLVAGNSTSGSEIAGVVGKSYDGAGIAGYSPNGPAVAGWSENSDGLRIWSNAPRISADPTKVKAVAKLISQNGCAHIQMRGDICQTNATKGNTQAPEQRIPYGDAGALASVYNRDGHRNFLMHCYKSTSDGRGLWQFIDGAHSWYGGALFT